MPAKTVKLDWVDQIKLFASINMNIDLYKKISKSSCMHFSADDIVKILEEVKKDQMSFIEIL